MGEKLFTSILNARLVKYCEEINLIGESQAGFRKDYSTIDQIFFLKCVTDLSIWKKNFAYLWITVKHFDYDLEGRSVAQTCQKWCKGKVFGIDKKKMYNNIKWCVPMNNEVSNHFVSHRGVRQGESLSPLLFAVYVNDLEKILSNENCSPLYLNEPTLDIYQSP